MKTFAKDENRDATMLVIGISVGAVLGWLLHVGSIVASLLIWQWWMGR